MAAHDWDRGMVKGILIHHYGTRHGWAFRGELNPFRMLLLFSDIILGGLLRCFDSYLYTRRLCVLMETLHLNLSSALKRLINIPTITTTKTFTDRGDGGDVLGCIYMSSSETSFIGIGMASCRVFIPS